MRVMEPFQELIQRIDECTQIERTIAVALEDLAPFLDDPIGFGDYDYADPITLDQYVPVARMHGRYAQRLA